MEGGLAVNSGLTVMLEGARVMGGMNLAGGLGLQGALDVTASDVDRPALGISAKQTKAPLIQASADGEVVMEVAPSGRLTVHGGGIEVSLVYCTLPCSAILPSSRLDHVTSQSFPGGRWWPHRWRGRTGHPFGRLAGRRR